ncbi:MAG: hypothetical protein AB1806_03630 [Acidobacteriota bacterium]
MTPERAPERCTWLGLREALAAFVRAESGTQGQKHIKPMHWYVACRLVIEGGFHPDRITPRPPFTVTRRGRGYRLHHSPESGGSGECTVFGGLKTKDIDVVVNVDGIGPCLAVSMKGTLNAFRNLTNRLEEAVGDCTNVHIAYPALVYGFIHLLRGNTDGPIPPDSPFLAPDDRGRVQAKDLAITSSGEVTDFVSNYARAMARLAGRRDLRDDVSRYEAISLILAKPEVDDLGGVFGGYPRTTSPLLFARFFEVLYREYDLRFVYGAPNLRSRTQRLVWDPVSPSLAHPLAAEFAPRVGEEDVPASAELVDETPD